MNVPVLMPDGSPNQFFVDSCINTTRRRFDSARINYAMDVWPTLFCAMLFVEIVARAGRTILTESDRERLTGTAFERIAAIHDVYPTTAQLAWATTVAALGFELGN